MDQTQLAGANELLLKRAEGILVDAGAVLKAVCGPETDALSRPRSFDRGAATSPPSPAPTRSTAARRRNRCPQTLVANKELKRFKARFVSLWALSKERGMYIATLKSKLDRARIEPAFDPVAIGARFYRRRDASRAP
jgi:hypothetical protein